MAFNKFMDLLGDTVKTMLDKDDESVKYNSSQYRNLIGFMGVSDGIGTSAFIAHLAMKLQSNNTPVLVVDLNFNLPTMYSWFQSKEFDISRSLTQLLNTNSADRLAEFTFRNADNGVSVVSPHIFKESPVSWCGVTQQSIHDLLTVARTHYAYVLVDLGSNFNINATMYGFWECNKVYTFTTPNEGHNSTLRSRRSYMEEYNKAQMMGDVIESMTLGDGKSYDEWASIKYNLVGSLPFDTDISVCIRNFTSINSVKLRSKAVNGYLETVKNLANQIRSNCAIEKDFGEVIPDDKVIMGKKVQDVKDW